MGAKDIRHSGQDFPNALFGEGTVARRRSRRPLGVAGTETWLPTRAAALAVLWVVLLLHPLFGADEPAEMVWNARTGMRVTAGPVTADVDYDGRLEILLISADTPAQATLLEPETGESLWDVSIATTSPISFAPIPGHFLGDGTIDFVLVTNDGSMILIDGGTGQTLNTFDLLTRPTAPPSLIPLGGRLGEAGDERHGVVLVDSAGFLSAFVYSPDAEPREVFKYPLPSRSDNSVAVGRTPLAAAFPHLIVATNSGEVVVLAPGDEVVRPLRYRLPGPPALNTSLAIGDLTGDGRDEIVVTDDRGLVHAIKVEGGKLESLWPKISVLAEPAYDPVLIDVNGDGKMDILIPKDKSYFLINGATGQPDIWEHKETEFSHGVALSSPPAVFTGADGRAYAVFGDVGGTLTLLDILAREIKITDGGARYRIDLDGENAANTPPIVGSLRGAGAAEVFVFGSRSRRAILANIGVEWGEASRAWSGPLGGGLRTASHSPYAVELAELMAKSSGERLEAYLAAAGKAVEEGDWIGAQEQALNALRIRPSDEKANEILRQAQFQENIVSTLIKRALWIAFAAGLAWFGWRLGHRRLRFALADRAIKRGNNEAALKHMRSASGPVPTDPKHVKALANLFIETRNYGPESSPVFRRASEVFSNEDTYIRALARAYSAEGRRDEEAARAYEAMVRVAERPAMWAFALGETYREIGDDRKALDAYHRAVKHGFENAELFDAMADLYVKLGFKESEIIPTMLRVLDRRQHDSDFLGALCAAYRNARIYDENAEKAARWLIELEPQSATAQLIVASADLKAARIDEALAHARALLAIEPEDPVGLGVMAHCLARKGEADEEALEIMRRALAANPKETAVLLALAQSYVRQEKEDDDAKDIYLRALRVEANDVGILSRLAKMATAQDDAELIVQSIEKLRTLGEASTEQSRLLAEAYSKLGVEEGRAEEVYREALAEDASRTDIAARLAGIYARQERTDADAVAVYEAAHQGNGKSLAIALQLAKAHLEASNADRALAIADELLQEHPGDAGVIRLAAQASAALDKLEDAIERYEGLLAQDEGDEDSVCQLASLYRDNQQLDAKAFDLYRRAVQLRPSDLEFHEALARCQAAQGAWTDVVETVKHYLTHAPKHMDQAIGLMEDLSEDSEGALKLQWFLVETLIYSRRYRAATERLRKIVEADVSQREQALSSLDKILAKKSDEAGAHQLRGTILNSMDRMSEARHSLERAHRFDRNNEAIGRDLLKFYQKLLEERESIDVRFQLGKLAMKLRELDLAISCFQRTDKDERYEAESAMSLGQCFIAKGMLDLAFHELRRMPAEDQTKQLLYELGKRYESSSDFSGAREVYKVIVGVDIGYKDAQKKLDRLLHAATDPDSPERTAILNTLSEAAKSRYDLIQELGRGAMGIVYKARDNELEEMVALKILPDSLGQNENALKLFRQEARNARRLAHPNVVRIHDIGEERGRKYISMEFIDGIDLKQRLIEVRRKLPFEETVHYAKQICKAMVAASEAHIVHRDLKPANIMITKKKQIKVADFGIAKLIQDETVIKPKKKPGPVVGTPLYMSPEQVKGEQVDRRADIYSAGAMFYEMVSGRPPFVEGDLAYHHVFTEPKPLGKDVDPIFANMVMKCLEKKPEDRWNDASEMFDELEKIKIGEDQTALSD